MAYHVDIIQRTLFCIALSRFYLLLTFSPLFRQTSYFSHWKKVFQVGYYKAYRYFIKSLISIGLTRSNERYVKSWAYVSNVFITLIGPVRRDYPLFHQSLVHDVVNTLHYYRSIIYICFCYSGNLINYLKKSF